MQYAMENLQKFQKKVDNGARLCYNAHIEFFDEGENYVRIGYDDGYGEDVHVPHVHVLSCLKHRCVYGFLVNRKYDEDEALRFRPFFLEVMSVIELKHISKSFSSKSGPIVALEDISLTVADGEIFGIIGLSGAGKSTLVRCINLLERPDSGEVLIDGVNLMTVSKKELLTIRQNIGMIFQSFNLLEQRNVLKNVTFPLEVAGWDKERAKARAMELLEVVGLSDRALSYPSQLSGGQKQRVAIARALATNPKYILCDEATSALDPNTTASILELLKTINKTMGVTVIIITHEMDVIERICHRVAVLDKSHVAEMGLVTEVFTDPKSDIARELVLPKILSAVDQSTGYALRLVFNGESSDKPVLSALVTECAAPVSILFADLKELDGKNYGQMLVTLPREAKEAFDKVCQWLTENRVKFSVEEANREEEVK